MAQKRGKNTFLISAISLKEVLASANIYGAVNGATFEDFVVLKLVPKRWGNACVVMDNAKIHHGEMVREVIAEARARLIYLPAYSPKFSC